MNTTLSQKMRYLRLRRDYTQEEVSAFLHLERAAYCNYENGRRTPSGECIVAIADLYGVSVDYLMRNDFTGNPFCRRLNKNAEHILKCFCRLEPSTQKEIMEYIDFRIRKEQTQI